MYVLERKHLVLHISTQNPYSDLLSQVFTYFYDSNRNLSFLDADASEFVYNIMQILGILSCTTHTAYCSVLRVLLIKISTKQRLRH